MATKQEIATVEEQLPAVSYDYGAEAGVGFEGTSGKDLSIPFLSILQSNSPQVEEENPSGSKPGLLYNTVTRELVDGNKGLVVIPVHKESSFVEWVPREKGGGFVAIHDAQSDVVKRAQANQGGARAVKLTAESGNDLIETHYVYALVLDEEGAASTGFCVISFTSTKIKPYRDWLTSMFTIKGKPPLFANRARIKTVKQKNEKGAYFNFQIEPLRSTWAASLVNPKDEAALLKEAQDFRTMVTSGVAKAAFETQDDNATVGADGVPF